MERKVNRISFLQSFSYSKLSALHQWWKQYKQSKIGVVGLVIFIIMILAAILAPVLATHDPTATSASEIYQSPNLKHLLGTNSQGQDVFSQFLFAGRISIMIGIIAAAGLVFIGTVIGLVSGYFGGWIDEILTRICDILLIIPRVPLMIILAASMPPGIGNMLIVLIIVGWTTTARKIRAQTLAAKQLGFVEAAKSTGSGNIHIIVNHILPNVAGIVIADFVLEITTAIMTESGLAYLGLSDPTRPSWGMMLNWAQNEGAFIVGAWWYWLFPGLAIALLSCACSFIGNTINDRFVLRLGRIKSKTKRNLFNVSHGTGIKDMFKIGRPKLKPEVK